MTTANAEVRGWPATATLRGFRTLAELADAVGRAPNLDALYATALDALANALGVTRASVLLIDDDGAMRFRAWRGLSDSYRSAVDGHSPWRADEREIRPLLIHDVDSDDNAAPYRSVLRAEGIRSLAFVPLLFDGRLLGKFMLYYGEPHSFVEEELVLISAIASQVAFAVAQRLSEERLQDTRAQLEMTLRAIRDPITVQTPAGTLLFANDAAATLLGFSSVPALLAASPGDIVQRFEIFDESGARLSQADLPGRVALLEGRPTDAMLRWRSLPDGQERVCEVRADPQVGDDGRVSFVVNVVRDLTEQRRLAANQQRARREAERTALRIASLQRVTAALSEAATTDQVARVMTSKSIDAIGALSGSLYRLDAAAGRLLLLSEAGEAPRRTSRPEHTALSGDTPWAEAVRTRMPIFLQSLAELHERYPALSEPTSAPPALGCIPLLSSSGVLGVLVLGFDTSQTFKAEERLFLCALADQGCLALERARLLEEERLAHRRAEAAHRRASFLASASSVLGSTLDVDRALRGVARTAVPTVTDCCAIRVLDADGKERSAFAHTAPADEGLLGAVEPLFRPRPDGRDSVSRALTLAESTLLPDIDQELWRELASDEASHAYEDELRPRSLMTAPMRARGRVVGAITFVSYDDARRYDEEDLAMAQSLAHRAALAVENAELFETAREVTRSREDLLAIVSHDLRTPLSAISLAAASLARVGEGNDRLTRSVGVIERNTARMEHLIRDLLDFSRIDAGELSIDAAPLAALAVLEEAIDTWRALAGQRELVLKCSIEPALEILANRESVLRVLGNLIGNAVRHTQESGRIQLLAERRKHDVLFSVVDDGPGIARADQPRLFDRWYRAVDGKPRGGGIGLGLFIARGLVEAHGGSICVDSAVGEGAAFRFSLPLAPAQGDEDTAGTAR